MDASSNAEPSSSWTPADRQFVVELLQQARAFGLAEVRYKDLFVRLTPATTATAYPTAQFSNSSWAPKLQRAGEDSK
jgi:hypothetical protein